jgi:hybrid cluster-associated redox disulfide protein
LRWRKDSRGENRYPLSAMNETLISLEPTVAEILEKYPQTAKVFIQYKTVCIGCYLARFCSLKDVVATYSLDENTFVAELHKALKNEIPTLVRSNK